jgi:hypothetical protein
MRYLLSFVMLFAVLAVADSTIQPGASVYNDGSVLSYLNEDGLIDQKQCPAGKEPVVVCKDAPKYKANIENPKGKCPSDYRTCFRAPTGDRFCVDKRLGCPKR